MEDKHPDKTGDNREYKVGDKHPPKEHRFKPGEVHNPKGRPPNKKYISEALRELAESDPEFLKELIKAIRKRGKEGDVPAFREIADRMDGKVDVKLDVGDVPVTIILKRAEDRSE